MLLERDNAASYLYRLARRDPHSPPGPVTLAIDLLERSDAVLEVDPSEVWGHGELVPDGVRWQIHVSNALDPERFDFTVAHELAEWYLKRIGIRPTDPVAKERCCDGIAAALIAPREAFQDSVREHGDDFADLAYDFRVTQTCAALRFGEVSNEPLAVVGPTVRVRGRAWRWGTDADVRRLAAAARPGLRKTQLTDQRRVVLMA